MLKIFPSSPKKEPKVLFINFVLEKSKMLTYHPFDPTKVQSFINDHAQHSNAASIANWGSIFEEYLKSVDVTITSLTDQELLNHVTNYYFQLVKKDGKPYKASSTSIGALGSYLRNAMPSFILNSYDADTGGELFKVLNGICKVEVMKSNPLPTPLSTKKNRSTDTILKIIDPIWWLVLVFILPSLEL